MFVCCGGGAGGFLELGGLGRAVLFADYGGRQLALGGGFGGGAAHFLGVVMGGGVGCGGGKVGNFWGNWWRGMGGVMRW